MGSHTYRPGETTPELARKRQRRELVSLLIDDAEGIVNAMWGRRSSWHMTDDWPESERRFAAGDR
jgi:hypothetical protein